MYVCGSGVWGRLSATSGARAFFASYWYRPENICTARRRVGVELNNSGLSEARSDVSSIRNLLEVALLAWAGAAVAAAAGGVVVAGAAGGGVGLGAAAGGWRGSGFGRRGRWRRGRARTRGKQRGDTA